MKYAINIVKVHPILEYLGLAKIRIISGDTLLKYMIQSMAVEQTMSSEANNIAAGEKGAKKLLLCMRGRKVTPTHW
jgi:hypothetical protein